jgi:hypothetical protein
MKRFLFAMLLVALAGCSLVRPFQSVQKGGKARVSGLQGLTSASQDMSQPENPKDAATQNRDETIESVTVIPEGSTEDFITTDSQGKPATNRLTYKKPTTRTYRHVLKAAQSVGAAQKDTGREIAAKLAAARPVQYMGVILVLAACAMFHPVVRAFVASTTVQAVVGAVGLSMIFGPMVIVGHEGLMIGGGLVLILIVFFMHRHGRLQGIVDANRNGIDDRTEGLPKKPVDGA